MRAPDNADRPGNDPRFLQKVWILEPSIIPEHFERYALIRDVSDIPISRWPHLTFYIKYTFKMCPSFTHIKLNFILLKAYFMKFFKKLFLMN